MAFAVIETGRNLTRSQRRQAAAAGPACVRVRTGHPSLLTTAGFTGIEEHDVTPAYRSTLAAWRAATESRSAEVVAVVGQQEFEERQQRRTKAITAVDSGLLRRTIYVARRTG